MDSRRLAAEAIGTFILVGIGSLSIVAATAADVSPLLIAPFGFGLALLAAIQATAHVSGGHYNPAVTLAAVLDRRLGAVEAVGYVVAQVIGAAAASAVVLVIASQAAVLGTRNLPGTNVTDLQAFLTEVVLTAVFLAVILTATRRTAATAPFAIAITLVVIHFAGIPISGASVNPARALGPALVGGDLTSVWIYLTAPFVGAAIGWGIFKLLDDEAAS
jgi:aquaporin Z